jgi:hypothetical protein
MLPWVTLLVAAIAIFAERNGGISMIRRRTPRVQLCLWILAAFGMLLILTSSSTRSLADETAAKTLSTPAPPLATIESKKCVCAGVLCSCELIRPEGNALSITIPKADLESLSSQKMQIQIK